MSDSLKPLFLLDPDIVFLNHGSFGACPRSVFQVYQRWQRELERQPVEFLSRRAKALLAEARAKLATYIGCAGDEVVYFPNPTTALNMVARSLDLRPRVEQVADEGAAQVMRLRFPHIIGSVFALCSVLWYNTSNITRPFL